MRRYQATPLLLTLLPLLSYGGTAGAESTFRDATEECGIDFVHDAGYSENLYMPEIMGSGVALFDYDRDGKLDIYFVNSGNYAEAPSKSGRDRLYRNVSRISGENEFVCRFADVTEESGITSDGYGMGVSIADVDANGWVDILVTNAGANRLYLNQGDGTFIDATENSGIAGDSWSVSASFADFNKDGLPDLYVGNYVTFSVATHKDCKSPTSASDYCGPIAYPAETDRLYVNEGDGRFRDISSASGIRGSNEPALGVISDHFNGDGRLDIYVANDGRPNLLWWQRSGMRFEEGAMLSGTAVNRSGSAEASMGVDAGDFDGDGDLDLFMTHRDDETNTLYVNEGNKWFSDKTNTVNLGEGSLKLTGFGTRFADFDNDGFLDLFVANGAVTKLEALSNADHPHPFDQPNQLFHNEGGMTFRVSEGEDAVGDVATSRGAAFGDIDNDGDVDIIVSNNHGPAQVLINQVGEKRSWIGFQLSADDPATVLPARLTVVTDDSRQLVRRAARDGSYASSNDPRVIVGLGDSDDPVSIEIQWATGETTSHDKFEVGKYHKVIRPRQDDVAIGSDG